MRPNEDRSIPGLEIASPSPPEPWALIVRSRQRQTEWRIHSERIEDRLTPQGAATTIIYWGQPHRIEREIEDSSGWTYFMRPWPDNATIFQEYVLSNEFIEARRMQTESLRRDHLKTEVAVLYDFLVGTLPSRLQYELSQGLGFDPVEATRRNAILVFFTGFFVLFFGGFASIPPLVGLLGGAGLALDGLIRWAWVITNDQVNGLLPWEITDRIGAWVVRNISGSKARKFPPRD